VTASNGCYAYENNLWQPLECLPGEYNSAPDSAVGVYKDEIFRDVAVMTPYGDFLGLLNDTHLYFFDGRQSWAVDFADTVRDVMQRDRGLFVLVDQGEGRGAIYQAKSLGCRCLGDFSLVARFDLQEGKETQVHKNWVMSLEFLEGRFYLGYADGRLFRSSKTQP